jgi:TolA-binding protein
VSSPRSHRVLGLVLLGAPWLLAPAIARAAAPKVEASASSDAEPAKAQTKTKTKRRGGQPAKSDDPPPLTSYQLELEIQSRESKIAVDRKRGIALLEEFIAKHSSNRAMPEALYRLAALYWERSQETFLTEMKAWADTVEKCRKTPEECPDGPPAEPQLELQASQKIYVRMIKDYPRFRKIDTVRYLYGFSLRDQGRTDEAQAQFQAIIRDHPTSSFVPDSWLAIGDHRFYVDNDFGAALEAYSHVLDYPESDPYAMALFKTAWCQWKLGNSELAIRRFKEVLDQGADPDQDEESRKRLADLREEALEYLVQVISEDEKYTAKDIYDFLAAIDGEKYSRKVLVRLAEAYEAQTRYDKSVPTWRFLIGLDANHEDNASFQVHVATGVRGSGDIPKALDELTTLEKSFGPRSAWGKAHVKQAKASHAEGEVILFDMARSVHESAQAAEKDTKVADKDRYALAARAYEDYTHRYPANPHAVEVSYLTGDIYLFKLNKKEQAGDAYLRVGESAPVGALHRDALLAAITAYEDAMAEAPPEPETPAPPPEGAAEVTAGGEAAQPDPAKAPPDDPAAPETAEPVPAEKA